MRPKNIAKEDAIRQKALEIIEQEGLENLSMQKLAKAANISPRTIYIKYADKEDLLVKLFIDEVLAGYEKAVLDGFTADMPFAEGIVRGSRIVRSAGWLLQDPLLPSRAAQWCRRASDPSHGH